LRTHEPEACYAGAGFLVHLREVLRLETPFGEIPVRRLLTSKGRRTEPVTYWIKVGDRAVMPSQSKLVELGYVLTGRVPDGLLFRVSSIDPDRARANRMHEHFINQLLQAVPPSDRRRLSGLGKV
jgi:EpsI family protein